MSKFIDADYRWRRRKGEAALPLSDLQWSYREVAVIKKKNWFVILPSPEIGGVIAPAEVKSDVVVAVRTTSWCSL